MGGHENSTPLDLTAVVTRSRGRSLDIPASKGAHATSVVIRLARYNRQCVRVKLQIVPTAVGGIGVVDLPQVIVVVEFDFAPAYETLVSQRGLDAGPLFGTRGPVCEYLSGQQRTRC